VFYKILIENWLPFLINIRVEDRGVAECRNSGLTQQAQSIIPLLLKSITVQ
jgi:hypothetical protein